MVKSYKTYIDNATWDCEISIVESSRIYRYLIKNGHKFVDNPSIADFIIINSCGFLKGYESKSLYLFDKYNSLKKENATIIMVGCLIKINPELIDSLNVYPIEINESNKLDKIFYKNIKFEDIKPFCNPEIKEKLLINTINKRPRYLYFFLTEKMLPFIDKLKWNYNKVFDSYCQNNRTLIEIGRGCAGNCSYCVIKKARGKIHSRPIQEILSDIEKSKVPSKKLYLVANDCGCYGIDIKTNLINLLYEINKKFPDLSIELDYLNPFLLERYSKEYIKLFNDIKVDFITVPMQSGSNKVLNNMNRKYDITEVIKIIDDVKRVSPKTFIYSHFIIGFPGESWIDFFKTLLCAKHFDLPVPFKYSENKNAASSLLPNHKSDLIISIRYQLSLIYFNFVIFYKLLSFPKY
jgi:MiaB/RimO family radical SAM methylthiotransferase